MTLLSLSVLYIIADCLGSICEIFPARVGKLHVFGEIPGFLNFLVLGFFLLLVTPASNRALFPVVFTM